MLYGNGGNAYICFRGQEYLNLCHIIIRSGAIVTLWLPAPLYQRGVQLDPTLDPIYWNSRRQQAHQMALIELIVAD